MAVQYKAEWPPQQLPDVEIWLNERGQENWQLITYTRGGLAIFSQPGSATLEQQPPKKEK